MSRATPKLDIFAERLLGYEVDAGGNAPGAAAFRVCEKLRHILSGLLGTAGFRALLARALNLARAEVAELHAVQIKPDGSLEGLGAGEPRADVGQISRGEIVLVAKLLGLLVTFIGEALMLGLVQDAWPEATLDDVTREKGRKS